MSPFKAITTSSFGRRSGRWPNFCAEDNIAMMPYSALAWCRLAKLPGETSKRLEEDSYAKFKYDATAGQNQVIIRRVAELAERRGVSMTEIFLAWLLAKVTAPVVGATKPHHIEGAVKAVEFLLSGDELSYLEGPYSHTSWRVHSPEHFVSRQGAPCVSTGSQHIKLA